MELPERLELTCYGFADRTPDRLGTEAYLTAYAPPRMASKRLTNSICSTSYERGVVANPKATLFRII